MLGRIVTGVVLVPILFSAPAAAQLRTFAPTAPSFQVGAGSGLSSYRPEDVSHRTAATCLTRRATGTVECHTFAEWRRIAHDLDSRS